jgi:hypothetical protein
VSDSTPPRPPAQRDGCLAFVMVLLGIVLLLPGVCALAFVVSDPKGMLTDSSMLEVLLVCLAIATGGIVLIWSAVKSR